MSSEFNEIALDDLLIKKNQGVNTTTEKIEYSHHGIPIIRANNITNGEICFSDIAFVDEQTFSRIKEPCKPTVGDILYTNIGSQFGCAAKVTLNSSFAIAWNVMRLQPKPGVNSDFLVYALNNPVMKAHIRALNSSSTMPFVSGKELGKVLLSVPSLKTQKTIASILVPLDDRIALLRETNATLEAIAQALFKSWFVDFDPVHAKARGEPPQGMDDATAALFPDSFEESELGIVPKGWRVGSLASVMDIAGGTQPPASEFIDQPKEGYIRLIQIRDYETDTHLTYVPYTSKLRTTTAEDIMIARYGASVGRICWGLIGAYNVALVRVVCENGHREFIRTYLSSNTFQSRLAAVSGRSAQAGFNKGDIASFKITIPNNQLLETYQSHAWPLRNKILHNRQQVQTLAQLRDTLLPKLISGQLRLPEAEALLAEELP